MWHYVYCEVVEQPQLVQLRMEETRHNKEKEDLFLSNLDVYTKYSVTYPIEYS